MLKSALNKLSKYEALFSSVLIVIIGCITYLPYINQLGLYFNNWRPLDSQISGVSLFTILNSEQAHHHQ
jgi:DNA phosphorothioation-dependent restriction protein DptG